MSLNVSTNTAALRAGAYLSQNNALLQRSLDRSASRAKKYPVRLMTLEAWRFR